MVINIILYVSKGRANYGFFMHLFWERYALVNVLLWPMTAIACFIFLMTAEFKYTLFSRFFYFVVGGA
jgi:cytochrome c oxidase subunit IV